ncbi:MAG: hypothetical protein QM820_52935 [Minicystis sp.]
MPRLSPHLAVAPLVLALGFAASNAAADEPAPPASAPSTLPPAPDPITVELGARAGFGYRIGQGPSFPITDRFGGVFGLGLAVAPWSRAAITLGWERSGAGTEHGQGDLADVEVSRSLDVIWAGVRLFLVRNESFGLLVQLGPGLAFQHANADVLVYPGAGGQASAFRCRESGGPGLALRAGLGVEAHISGPVWFTTDAVIDHANLSSGALGDCVPGVGSLSTFGLRFGLVYRVDVSRWLR